MGFATRKTEDEDREGQRLEQAYQRGWDEGREALEQELHEERNQTAIREGQLGLRVDELEAAIEGVLASGQLTMDWMVRLRGLIKAGLPQGQPVVCDAAGPGSAAWTARLVELMRGGVLVVQVGGSCGRTWLAMPATGELSARGDDLREVLATVCGMLEAMEEGG